MKDYCFLTASKSSGKQGNLPRQTKDCLRIGIRNPLNVKSFIMNGYTLKHRECRERDLQQLCSPSWAVIGLPSLAAFMYHEAFELAKHP